MKYASKNFLHFCDQNHFDIVFSVRFSTESYWIFAIVHVCVSYLQDCLFNLSVNNVLFNFFLYIYVFKVYTILRGLLDKFLYNKYFLLICKVILRFDEWYRSNCDRSLEEEVDNVSSEIMRFHLCCIRLHIGHIGVCLWWVSCQWLENKINFRNGYSGVIFILAIRTSWWKMDDVAGFIRYYWTIFFIEQILKRFFAILNEIVIKIMLFWTNRNVFGLKVPSPKIFVDNYRNELLVKSINLRN